MVLSDAHHAYYQRLGEKASEGKASCEEAGGFWTGAECYFGGGSAPSAPLEYHKYYPGGYSDCVKDQKCRGNAEARTACINLMNGDPSGIKREKGMAKGAIFMLDCNRTFQTVQLGPKMEASAITGSVIDNIVTAKDPYRGTGGVGSTTPETSVLEEGIDDVKGSFKDFNFPSISFPTISAPFKAMGGLLVLFALGIIALIAIGYSGMGGAGGEIASREHKRKRG